MPTLEICQTAWEATVGLLGRDHLAEGGGLLIPGCRSIHMIGMRFAIDVVYMDGDLRVCKLVEGLRPWRLSASLAADSVLELPAGAARQAGIEPGRIYLLQPTPAGGNMETQTV